jgi:hypothetical protein
MRRALLGLGLAVLGIVCHPAPARASISWWDYLEEMSGPGPFDKHGPLGVFTIDTGVACRLANPQDGGSRWVFVTKAECLLDPTRTGSKRVQDFFAVRLGASSTDASEPLFQDRPGELRGKVTAWTIDLRFKRRLDAALVLAAGGGVLFLTGDTIDQKIARPTVTPLSVEFTPLGLLHRTAPQKYDGLVGLRFEQMVILGGLDARDFNQASTSAFHTDKTDLIRRFSITVDISPFVFARSR